MNIEPRMLDRLQTVADLVLDHSECAEVFQKHRIDFCCRGDLTLEQAAKGRQLDVDTLVTELTGVIDARKAPPLIDVRTLSTPQLVAHILLHHHDSLCRALPLVRTLANKVARVHGEHNPKLLELKSEVDALSTVLTPHLEEEVRSVFPVLSGELPTQEALQAMTDDHGAISALLVRIRAASEDFALPDWACMSYRTLFSELRQLEAQLSARLHLENHVLRPRFPSA